MVFELPAPELQGSESLVGCIEGRRSVRQYTKAPLPIAVLSQLLWAAQGLTGPGQKRATPSAGGLYPLHLQVVVQRVSALEPGTYEYKADSHSLKLVGDRVRKEAMHELGIGDQPWLKEAAIVIGVSAKLGKAVSHFESQPPHGERGARYVYMETGALAQNVHLQSTALGAGCVLVAGFDDAKVKEALRLPSNMEPTALLCIGQRRDI
ncbi:SagB/ThcOx family dehydrogenase [Marinobacter persicus]|uniref:SagB-type dehydrogenase family enzyme n=1 Tax=Marinobacter persicus TaxID=930118 RepID=A0A2S6G1Q0_9GAMM|nr:SagB/ThcOx family dehydrogenase [Marinobacter persicus]KXS52817.1 MAG: Nitroreductase [Marinobacter sp. T13-3]PPK48744.1 SagB-type dehydrogenase family enzyme [Marinobacter persicus]PPK50355.1 SagB-type dehydrogenase family enzyme [Marinobacter persicus]PPK54645.1 SagB-type dehydrogenase family enzyme [Marinobacter persicus]